MVHYLAWLSDPLVGFLCKIILAHRQYIKLQGFQNVLKYLEAGAGGGGGTTELLATYNQVADGTPVVTSLF